MVRYQTKKMGASHLFGKWALGGWRVHSGRTDCPLWGPTCLWEEHRGEGQWCSSGSDEFVSGWTAQSALGAQTPSKQLWWAQKPHVGANLTGLPPFKQHRHSYKTPWTQSIFHMPWRTCWNEQFYKFSWSSVNNQHPFFQSDLSCLPLTPLPINLECNFPNYRPVDVPWRHRIDPELSEEAPR